jgi:IstB-like ATP binding protein
MLDVEFIDSVWLIGIAVPDGPSRSWNWVNMKQFDVDAAVRITILAALNLPYATWPDFLSNPALTKALLSRLRERCHTVTIEGPCIRPQTG